MPVAGIQLSVDEALALCYAVGWRSGDLTKAVAVMTAESGRYTKAWHDNDDGSTDRGLFQVNSLHAEHLPIARMFWPVRNAMFAFQLSGEGGHFTPWAAYNSGAYKKFVRSIRLRKLFHPWRWRQLVSGWELP